ncbi:hypothetical protein EDB92DRAFT_883882 [Lactarius akahatsu]|uniref:Uncharacterized protein n=1 Tax=Lactarius akahatsu TaxID=416441 RepID=A0AAD4Q9T4_9AGAM|nr:hypothetical protein EDB92DRAFT_883882 [Lactarius akahatsu]
MYEHRGNWLQPTIPLSSPHVLLITFVLLGLSRSATLLRSCSKASGTMRWVSAAIRLARGISFSCASQNGMAFPMPLEIDRDTKWN